MTAIECKIGQFLLTVDCWSTIQVVTYQGERWKETRTIRLNGENPYTVQGDLISTINDNTAKYGGGREGTLEINSGDKNQHTLVLTLPLN
jgi:hypothetical protein